METSDKFGNTDVCHSCRKGIVTAVDGGEVTVRIWQASSCSSCKVQRLCGSSESRQLLVNATVADGEQIHVDDEVELMAVPSIEREASLLAFGVPLGMVLLWIPVAVFGIGFPDWLAVVTAVGWVMLYLLLMRLWHGKWEKRFALSARKI